MPHVTAAPAQVDGVELDHGVHVFPGNKINVDITLPLAAAALLAGSILQLDSATAPVWSNPPVITGAKGGNAALTSLISSLASKGWIIDSTS